jgi:hypothetical protein
MLMAWLIPIVMRLDSTKGLTLIDVDASAVSYQGRRAVRLTETGDVGIALIDGLDFSSGTLEVHLTGGVVPNPADTSSRGFVGIIFRSGPRGEHYENVFLRMTNGRANDQLRRNHAVQYERIPDAPWYKLRQEHAGQYESYADVAPGEWTTLRIVVEGTRARVFVNGAAQPCLIVHDLTPGRGRIGLWVGASTVAYFSRLEVTPAN